MSSGLAPRTVIALPFVLGAIAFSNTIGNDFVYDDVLALDEIPSSSFVTSWTFLRTMRGATSVVNMLDHRMWGTWAPGFHLTNIALHSLACALVAGAALVLTHSRRAALLCGLLFAVHPVHVEAVASVANRKDVLAMIFVLLALILWMSARAPKLCYAGALLCTGLGLLAKEAAAAGVIPMLFLADVLHARNATIPWPRRVRRATLRVAPFLVLGVVAMVAVGGDFRRYFGEEAIRLETIGYLRSYEEVLATAASVVPENLRLLFVPRTLSADYPVQPQTSIGGLSAVVGIGLAACWLALAVLLRREAPMVTFGMAWVAITYLPCSNVVPLTKFFVAERYLYVPSFGACLVGAVALDAAFAFASRRQWRAGRVGVAVLAAGVLLVGAVRTVVRNRDWRDDVSLWSSSLRAGLETSRIHDCLAGALVRQGRYDEAIAEYSAAVRTGPPNAYAMVNLAALLWNRGRRDEAVVWCRRVLAIPAYNAQYRDYHERCREILELAGEPVPGR